MEDTLPLSVIVPVWNGADEIMLLLAALDAQTAPRDTYEVLIVDNGSTDDTAKVVAAHPGITLLSETRPGSYAARNHAVANARGRFLLFTDADCVPTPDWVETALRLADTHSEDCLIGGKVSLFSVGRTGRHSVRYEQTTGFPQDYYLANRMCVTANWLCSGRLLERAGGFDASLMSGGDIECAGRIADTGAQLIYAPELEVGHPTRASLPSLLRKRRRVIGGQWQKAGEERSFVGSSKAVFRHNLDQARWLKGEATTARDKLGILSVVGSLWLISQLELMRLRLGGRPTRS